MSAFQWLSLMVIVVVAVAGGYVPLFRPERARRAGGFPLGQAFAAGVFLALGLTMMLPSAFALYHRAFPMLDYPVAALVAITAFLVLLGLEHWIGHVDTTVAGSNPAAIPPGTIPVIMTIMIAVPSFFLGTALGISSTTTAWFILIAIVVHKGSAAFALALKMVRSRLTRTQTLLTFGLFLFATPVGIIVGSDVHQLVGSYSILVVKGTVLSLAAGTFLYMGTLHELRASPLIQDCSSLRGFGMMLAGFILTALVRLLIGVAHQL